MGEAKRRGSFDKRKAESIERHKEQEIIRAKKRAERDARERERLANMTPAQRVKHRNRQRLAIYAATLGSLRY